MYEHLIEFYNKKKFSIKRYLNDTPEAIEIRQLTSFLDDSGLFSNINYKQRIWHIINNQLSLKTCVICNNPVHWDKGNKRYPETCDCIECRSKYAASDVVVEKRIQTNLRKYGVKYLQQTEEWKNNLKNHNLQTYGVVGYTQTEEFKEKSKKTCLKKYGSEYYYQTDEFKEKADKTRLRKFGAISHSQSDHWKSLMYDNFKNTLVNLGYYDLGYKLISYKGNGDYEIYCPHCE